MLLFSKRPRGGRRRGYTLVEASIALSLTAMAGAVVLLTVETSLDASDQSLQQTVAAGLAEQLLDEALGARYYDPASTPRQLPLAPSSWELQGSGRERFNENGDYQGYSSQPPKDLWGKTSGQGDGVGNLRHANFRAPSVAFDRWRQRVEVYYVNSTNPSLRLASPQTSDCRAIEVVIERQLTGNDYLELARLRRVVANLPKVP